MDQHRFAPGLESSVLGLGCMGMSEFYGARDDDTSLATLERALDLGVTHYDTADMYGRGHNEELLGRFLKSRRDTVFIATKFGVVREPGGKNGSLDDRRIDNTPKYIEAACDASLRRLGIETIDLYYVHRINPAHPMEETIGTLSRLIAAGKIRAIGLSEVSKEQLRRACVVHPVAAVQSEYSLWARHNDPILPVCRELDVSFVAYSPLGRGLLTGRITSAQELSDDDYRRSSPRFKAQSLSEGLALVEVVKEIARMRDATPGQIALAWLLARGIVPIPGTKRIRYLEENVGAVSVSLTATELERLDNWPHPSDATLAK